MKMHLLEKLHYTTSNYSIRRKKKTERERERERYEMLILKAV